MRKPHTLDGLYKAQDTIAWRLEGCEAELRSVLDTYQRHRFQLDEIRERIVEMGADPDGEADDEGAVNEEEDDE